MHGDKLKYVTEAYKTNWMSTIGKNINEAEQIVAEKIGCQYAVALSSGTAALHLCMKLAGIKPGLQVFCSDVTFAATVNPVVYEGGMLLTNDLEQANRAKNGLPRAVKMQSGTSTRRSATTTA